jgi:hypothetical protein
MLLLLATPVYASSTAVPQGLYDKFQNCVVIPQWFNFPQQFLGDNVNDLIVQADIDQLKGAGITGISLMLGDNTSNYNFYDPADPSTPSTEWLAELYTALDLLFGNGLAVILRWHPGSTIKSNIQADTGDHTQADHLAFWPALVALVLANTNASPTNLVISTMDEEPGSGWTQGTWKAHEELMITALRAVAADYTIHVGFPATSFWNQVTAGTTRSDTNLIYANHWYSPTQFTTQGQSFVDADNVGIKGLQWPPDLPNVKELAVQAGTTNADSLTAIDTYITDDVDEAEIRDRFRQLHVWATDNNAKILVSEYGVSSSAPSPSRGAWLEALTGHMRSRGFGGCRFSYSSGAYISPNVANIAATGNEYECSGGNCVLPGEVTGASCSTNSDCGGPGQRSWLPGELRQWGRCEGTCSARGNPPTTTTTTVP